MVDQLNRKVQVPFPPKRIISLVPSQTELLFDLGLEEEVVGITKFCVRPSRWFRNKTRVGGTKTIHLDRIHDLQPDLILANKEENDFQQITSLMADYPVCVSDVKTLEDALEMIRGIGALTGKGITAHQMAATIQQQFNKLPALNHFRSALYFVWRAPYMVAGGDTFINQMMHFAGYKNLMEQEARYPEISSKMLKNLAPEVILLPTEPFPFKEKHRLEFEELFPGSTVKFVDGEVFSWYGSRLLYAANIFEKERSES